MQSARMAPARLDRRRRGLLLAVAFAMAAGLATLVFGSGMQVITDEIGVVIPIIGSVGYTLVGTTILWQRPAHPLGRLATAIGVAFSVAALLSAAVAATTPDGFFTPGRTGLLGVVLDAAIWTSDTLIVGGIVLGGTILIARFPSGRRTSRLGTMVEVGVAIAIVGGVTIALAEPTFRAVGWSAAGETILDVVIAVAVGAILGSYLLALVDLVLRYRRATGIERVQLRWVVAAAALPVGVLAALLALGDRIWALWYVMAFTLVLPIAAIAIAITRYRLYDIDRIVSRTIGYAVVTAVLFGVFFIANVALQRALGDVVGASPIVVAASTLVVAALFQPLRTRVQRVVDRRFHRARYDADLTVAGFAGRLRDQLDLPTLTGELRRATIDAVEPSATTVWLRARGVR